MAVYKRDRQKLIEVSGNLGNEHQEQRKFANEKTAAKLVQQTIERGTIDEGFTYLEETLHDTIHDNL